MIHQYLKPVVCRFCLVALAALAILLAGCSSFAPEPPWKAAVAGDGPGNPALLAPESVTVENLPRSRSGNSPTYEVFGVRYAVLDSAKGFREQGIASWYGTKFHGNATSSGEIYDMYQLSAAHKHLPLPTFVRVTRIDTGQSLIVKVNDRGPFVGDRVIDLSYAAAASLDMLEYGKAEVLIEAISHNEEPVQEHASATQVASAVQEVPAVAVQVGSAKWESSTKDEVSSMQYEFAKDESLAATFIQLGAFSDASNAEALKRRVADDTQLPVAMNFEAARELYRVVVGPLKSGESVSLAKQRLTMNGFSEFSMHRSSVQ